MGKVIHTRKKKNLSTESGGMVRSVVAGAVISIVLTGVLTGIEAWLANRGVLSVEFASKLSYLVWGLSGILGGCISGKGTEQGMAVKALLSGAIYAAVMLLVTGLAYGAMFEGGVAGLAIILASSLLGGILASIQNGKPRKNRAFR